MLNIQKMRFSVCILVAVVLLGSVQPALGYERYMWPTPSADVPYGGYSATHRGLDIAVPMYTRVLATKSGTVEMIFNGCHNSSGSDSEGVSCEWRGICTPNYDGYWNGGCNNGFGNGIVLRHDDGEYSVYAHLFSESRGLQVGDQVLQGQFIGLSGSTGNSTGPHLHFELRHADDRGVWHTEQYDPSWVVSPDDYMEEVFPSWENEVPLGQFPLPEPSPALMPETQPVPVEENQYNPGYHNFVIVADDAAFKDIPAQAWYARDVEFAYRVGLVNGITAEKFAPNEELTIAQAVKLAAVLHAKYYGLTIEERPGAWYAKYEYYALSYRFLGGWITEPNRIISRAEFAVLFAMAMPQESLRPVQNYPIGSIPDVPLNSAYAFAVYTLYNAGILNGVNNTFNFEPNLSIRRCEAASLIARAISK